MNSRKEIPRREFVKTGLAAISGARMVISGFSDFSVSPRSSSHASKQIKADAAMDKSTRVVTPFEAKRELKAYIRRLQMAPSSQQRP